MFELHISMKWIEVKFFQQLSVYTKAPNFTERCWVLPEMKLVDGDLHIVLYFNAYCGYDA